MNEFNTYRAAHILTQQNVLATCMRTHAARSPGYQPLYIVAREVGTSFTKSDNLHSAGPLLAAKRYESVAKTILHDNRAASLLNQSIIVTFASLALAESGAFR